MDAVDFYRTQLIDSPDRFDTVIALVLDETLFCGEYRFQIQCPSTKVVDVWLGQLFDAVDGRDSSESCRCLAAQPDEWRDGVEWVMLDLSASYRAVVDTTLADAVHAAELFHAVKLANTARGVCRRRLQNETRDIEAASTSRSAETAAGC